MSQIRAIFKAINPLKTLYKVRNTSPNYYSDVVEPLYFLRNFRFFFNNPAAEDLAENNNNNNNNNHVVEYSQSGIYKGSSGGFGQDWLIRVNNRDFNSYLIRKDGLFSENLRQNYSTMANRHNTSSGYQESNDADKSSKLGGFLEQLDAFCKEGKLKEAVEVMGLLEKQQISIDLQRYLLMINACGEYEALEEAKYVHEHLMRSLHILDVSTNNKILDMYGKCDSMEDAWKVFNGMPLQRNLTSWGTMITSLAKNGFGEDAIELFTEFKKIGLKPDSEMFFGVFFACSVVGDVNEGLLHFESMSKDYGIVPSMKHYVSVVEMLASNGYLDEALEFIEKMSMEPSVDVLEVLMNFCRVHGHTVLGDRCAELVEQLDPSRLDEYSKEGLIRVTDADIAKEEERKKKKLARENPPESAKLYALLWGLRQQMIEEGYVPDVKSVLHDLDPEGKEDCLLAHSERLDVAWGLICSPARYPLRVRKSLRVCHDCRNALRIISKLVGREISIKDATGYFRLRLG